jgi:hypothetical protein
MFAVYQYIFNIFICDKFYQRMLLNFSKIRTQKVEDPVAKHFCQKNHCGKNFKVIGIRKRVCLPGQLLLMSDV